MKSVEPSRHNSAATLLQGRVSRGNWAIRSSQTHHASGAAKSLHAGPTGKSADGFSPSAGLAEAERLRHETGVSRSKSTIFRLLELRLYRK
jgi:hypothetical protein